MERTPGRPRRSREIFAATLDLLAENGWDALTVEAIAARAGVNRTTIYRTWATKDEVFADALVHAPQLAFSIPDTGALRGDLIALGGEIARLLTDPAARRILAAVVSAAPSSPDRPATAEAARAFFADRLEQERPIFTRAADRGELDDPASGPMIIDLLAGNLWFHVIARGGTADDAYIGGVVDTILGGAAPRSSS